MLLAYVDKKLTVIVETHNSTIPSMIVHFDENINPFKNTHT